MTGPLVLPDDIEIVPVTALSAAVRGQIGGADDEYAVTRPLSRYPSKVINSQAAAWLRQFEKPTTLVDAILRHSKAVEREPQEILEEIYPFLESCLQAKLLVEPGVQSQMIEPCFVPGEEVAYCRIEECVQVLADSEIYRVTYGDRRAALKITRPEAVAGIKQNLAREAAIQKKLNGHIAPRLVASGETRDGRAYLVLEWIAGQLCTENAAVLRMSSRDPLPPDLLGLCGKILDAYTTLHGLGVIHCDVHPGNILVGGEGDIRIIDYGLSRVHCDDNGFAVAPRGGVGFFLDPEYAGAALARVTLPAATFAGEQYSIAALIYHLVSGRYYLDFSLEKESLLKQIVEQPPVPLADRGLPGTAALDRLLLRALGKEPSSRYPDMASMATAYWHDVVGADSPKKGGRQSSSFGTVRSHETAVTEDWLNSFLNRRSGPDGASYASGSARTAYAWFRLACIREDPDLLALAEISLDRAERVSGKDRPRPGGGSVEWCDSDLGLCWLRALMAHCCWDFHRRSRVTTDFLACCDSILGCGTASAQASALLASSLLVDAFRWEPTSGHGALIAIGNRLLDRLWVELDRLPPVELNNGTSPCPFMASAECLYATLQWVRAAQLSAPAQIEGRLHELAGQARGQEARDCLLSQDLPRAAITRPGDARFVFLWTLAFRVLKDRQWLRLAKAAGRKAANSHRGGSSLGDFVGKAYGQLCLYKHTGDRCWLKNADEIANAAVRFAERADRFRAREGSLGLDEDELGLAILISDLAHPRCSAMPFFEEECWPARAS